MVEIGVPYSDPLADGPTIQASSQKALDNGMTISILLAQLQNIRQSVDIPLIFMGYLNPMLQYGFEKLLKAMAEIGIDGLIIPDLPPEEFTKHYQALYDKYQIAPIYLTTPQSSPARIRYLDNITKGFLYVVSSASITGRSLNYNEAQIDYFKRIEAMKLTNPRLIGFGIQTKSAFEMACRYASGAIIGSAFIKALADYRGDLDKTIETFMGNFSANSQ